MLSEARAADGRYAEAAGARGGLESLPDEMELSSPL
jgi:hypothetical protein